MTNQELKASPNAYAIIKDCEGLFLASYRCPAGILTIGWGHTKGVTDGMRISLDQASEFLRDDVAVVEKGIRALVKVPLRQGQFDALCSFAFNLGLGSLKRSTLLDKLNDGDAAGAAKEFDVWVRAKGVVLPGLVSRRARERALFEQV